MKAVCNIYIKNSKQNIIDFLTDPTQLGNAVSGIKKMQILSSTQKGIGTTFRETRVMGGKEATEDMTIASVTESSIVITAQSHGVSYVSTYSLKEEGDGVNVELCFEGTPKSLMAKIFSFIGLLFMGMIKKLLLKDLNEIKNHLETL